MSNYSESVQQVYAAYNQAHATSAERSGWDSEAAQQQNFDAMLGLVQDAGLHLDDLSIHDAGCGGGDLIDTLVAGGGVRGYVGTDFLPDSLEHARRQHPTHDFREVDLERDPLPKADLTLCFGALAFHKPRAVEAMLHRLWNSSDKGLGFITWWNLTQGYLYFDQAEQLRKCIRRFIRQARPAKLLERVGDYGDPLSAMFLLTK